MIDEPAVTFAPAAAGRLADIAAVIVTCGDPGHCWCAYWYRPNADYRQGRKNGGNRLWLEEWIALVGVPGVLAYRDGRPVGWCGVARRSPTRPIVRLELARG
jgi:hypothetical protein